MALGSPDYRGPQVAHLPGTVLDLLEWAPIILTPDDLSRLLSRVGFGLIRQFATPEGRRAWVREMADEVATQAVEPAERRYRMGVAGLVSVAPYTPLYANIPDGSWVGC